MLSNVFQTGHTPAFIEGTPPPSKTEDLPGFHVLTLPSNHRYDSGSSTLYLFPYDEAFYTMFARYGGMLGLLINGCSGANGTMTAWEGTTNPPPKTIDQFYYHGQTIVALGTQHSVGFDEHGNKTSETWDWMGNATTDWRASIWNPTKGIGFTRLSTQTLGSAELVLLYSVPLPSATSTDGGGKKCKM